MAEIGQPNIPYPGGTPEKDNNLMAPEECDGKTLVEEVAQGLLSHESDTKPLSSQHKSKPSPSQRRRSFEKAKTVYEAWNIVRIAPPAVSVLHSWGWFGIVPWVRLKRRHPAVEIHVLPQNFYSQTELKTDAPPRAWEYLCDEEQHVVPPPILGRQLARKKQRHTYEEDLDRRVRRLDEDTRRRLEELVDRRTRANSSNKHRREYRLVALTEVSDGRSVTGMDGGPKAAAEERLWYKPWARKRPEKMEYRVILEGVEVKRTEPGTKWVWNQENARTGLWDERIIL